ncbi:hypothetical protein PHYSODRAFT_337895 [Phytophthora sojae]|uniref:ubiquitinyl hydrolase 1 n=1 Tax=Phytophthora sojae (strain P6497) TaxID=1094619 RepID=G4ZZC0_PHYSP|nr:hypothetical protein PHYSODRAFT_337895 [Phytophthora sojae]EGZ11142.1 hypothetical protein PHYSODRAFT_337895 [Phytophthora sojae]|eukprot:XP_009533887.1 hypothetical protein PHYSODRAFT_337895 [Phytophthora sojae]
MTSKKETSRVAKLLKTPLMACTIHASRFGAFDGTRLNIVPARTEGLREQLKEALVRDLIDDAPFEFMWLGTFGAANAGESLVKAIIDPSVSLEEALGGHRQRFTPYLSQLLALRGLIAFGVLEHCMEKRGAQALIDTGALLAGVANHDAAEFLLLQPDFEFQGVTYYDSREAFNCWVVVEKHRRLVTPLKSASMHEKETFVIFDEARSRGSDMKLPHEASALLTLGPKLTKDKLMQGAGRMRQLGCSQTLWIASFDEVAQSVLQSSDKSEVSGLTAVDVLNWVVDNTKAESVRGLLEWAGNGIHFRKTQLDPTTELIDENWSLEFLYEGNLKPVKLSHAIETKVRGLDDALIARICERGAKYGLDDEVYVSLHTDECERELQVEEEVQHQRELELAQYIPASEKTWNYSATLQAKSVKELAGVVEVVDMESFIRKWVRPEAVADLAWSRARIFGTENFFSTILAREGKDQLSDFLGVVDVMVVLGNGEVLLVSGCEADHILQLLWSSRRDLAKISVRFVNLAFAYKSIRSVDATAKFGDGIDLELGSGAGAGSLTLLATVASHVYNGETMVARGTLSNFVKSRGNTHKWTHSFLQELCARMDLDDCI